MKNTLPDIEFERKLVVSKHGKYTCPFGCRSSYGLLSWKTEKGYKGHMDKCCNKPSYVEAKRSLQLDIEAYNNILKEECAISGLLPYSIGDHVYYFGYLVTKPTHVNRFNRMVRVRYDEERSYYSKCEIVKSVDFDIPMHYKCNKSIEKIIQDHIVINGHIRMSNVCSDLAEAQQKALECKLAYENACEFAARCR